MVDEQTEPTEEMPSTGSAPSAEGAGQAPGAPEPEVASPAQPPEPPTPPAEPRAPAPAPPAPAAPPAQPGAPTAPPPPADEPAPPPAKKSKKWLWIGCGCLVLLLIVCGVVAALVGTGVLKLGQTFGAPMIQLNADLVKLKAGNWRGVYDSASDSFKENTAPEQFQAFVKSQPLLTDWTGQSDPKINVNNDLAEIKVTLKTDDASQRYEFQYTKVGDGWKLQFVGTTSDEDATDEDGS